MSGPLRLHPLVDVLAEVARRASRRSRRPSRWSGSRAARSLPISSRSLTTVHIAPGDRLEVEAVGVADAGGEDAAPRPRRGRTPRIAARPFSSSMPFVGDVGVGADGGEELRAVGTGDHVLGPVVVDRRAGRSNTLLAGARSPTVWPARVREADHAVGVGDVERVAHQGHAERLLQARGRRRSCVSATPSPSASRSRMMLLGLGTAAPTFFISSFWNEARDALVRTCRALGSRPDSAASTSPFGQHQQPARMVQALGVAGDREARRRAWAPRRPASRPRRARRRWGSRLECGAFSCGLGPKPTKGSVEPGASRARATTAAGRTRMAFMRLLPRRAGRSTLTPRRPLRRCRKAGAVVHEQDNATGRAMDPTPTPGTGGLPRRGARLPGRAQGRA